MRKIVLGYTMVLIASAMMACAVAVSPNTVPPMPAATSIPPSPDVPVVGTVSPSDPASRTAPLSSFDPRPGDDLLIRGNVFITSAQLLQLETFPVQVRLSVKGALPTPCHQLRAQVLQASALIQIEMYSLVSPNVACVQVIKEFTASIPLGSTSSGKFTVMLNNKPLAEFNAP